jgi:hypothetical protein
MSRLIAMAVVLHASTILGARDATLWRTDGTQAALALGGTPAVLFYEDRGSHDWNQPLKDALFERGRTRGLLDRVRVVAVANVAMFDFFPAREIATGYLRRLERQVGVPILLDRRGVLAREPWNLPSTGAAVVVFDRRGEPVLERRGRLSPADVDATIAAVERLVAEEGP